MEGESRIAVGQYLHEGNVEAPYFVLGSAKRRDSLDKLPYQSTVIGEALAVAGYEETGEVTGEPIKVIESDEQGLQFVTLGHFEAPENVVVYRQLRQGSYPSGQLWWRPPENFKKHFVLDGLNDNTQI